MGSFRAKYIFFELKRYTGVIFHETKDGQEICGGIDSSFQNWPKNLTIFDLSTRKSPKFSFEWAPFEQSIYFLSQKKYRGVIFHETEEGYKICRGIDLFQNWHKEFENI